MFVELETGGFGKFGLKQIPKMTSYLGKCRVPTLRGYILETKRGLFRERPFEGITQCTNLPKIYFHFVS
jgi:hypothetical protein